MRFPPLNRKAGPVIPAVLAAGLSGLACPIHADPVYQDHGALQSSDGSNGKR